MSPEEKLKILLRKSKEASERKEEAFENYHELSQKKLVLPVFHANNQYFKFDRNKITYRKDKEWRMVTFDTNFIDCKNYEFIVKLKENNHSTIVGLISKEGLPEETTFKK